MNLSVSTISPVHLRTTKTNMDHNNNFFIIEADQTTHKCTAMLINFSSLTQKCVVGESITSQTFEMTCPKIGKSSWTLILFPAGQYEFEKDNGQLSVYLKMVACENENENLLADVKFFIDSEEKYCKVVQASTFHYKNARTRWVGTQLVGKSELNAEASCRYLMRENSLVIGCQMIHPAPLNEVPNCIVQDDIDVTQEQPSKLKNVDGNSLEIDVHRPSQSYSSPPSVQSHVNGTKDLSENGSSTPPSTSKL